MKIILQRFFLILFFLQLCSWHKDFSGENKRN